jgi:hypothetical protein
MRVLFPILIRLLFFDPAVCMISLAHSGDQSLKDRYLLFCRPGLTRQQVHGRIKAFSEQVSRRVTITGNQIWVKRIYLHLRESGQQFDPPPYCGVM